MATSGTTTFSMNRDAVIKASLRLMGVLGQGDTPSTEDYTNCSEALNILIKSLMTQGSPLWTLKEVLIPMVTGQASYTIGPSGNIVTDRPLRILDGFSRDNTGGNDVTLYQLSRDEYDALGLKTTSSYPNSFYYDPQLTNGVVYFFGVSPDTTKTIHLHVQRPIQDMNSSTDDFDFPNEWFQCLKWNLAAELGIEYGLGEASLQRIEMKAMKFKDDLLNWSQEDTSIYFQPTRHGQGR